MSSPQPDRGDDDSVMPWITGFFEVFGATALIMWGVLQFQLAQELDLTPQTVGSIR